MKNAQDSPTYLSILSNMYDGLLFVVLQSVGNSKLISCIFIYVDTEHAVKNHREHYASWYASLSPVSP